MGKNKSRPLRQSRPNYTQFPNDYLDSVMRELTGTEWKIISAIARQTYGYGKDSDALSMSRLVDLTGQSAPAIKRSIISLENKGYLVRSKGNSVKKMPTYWLPELGSKVSRLALNRDQNDPTNRDQNDPTNRDQNDPQQKKDLKIKKNKGLSALRAETPGPKKQSPAPKKIKAIPTGKNDGWKNLCARFDDAQKTSTGSGISGAAWGREGKALSALLDSHQPGQISAQLDALTKLTKSGKDYWSSCPLTPSALRARWDQINAILKPNKCDVCRGTGKEISMGWKQPEDGWTWMRDNQYERTCRCQKSKKNESTA